MDPNDRTAPSVSGSPAKRLRTDRGREQPAGTVPARPARILKRDLDRFLRSGIEAVLRSGATVISMQIRKDPERNRLKVVLDHNGTARASKREKERPTFPLPSFRDALALCGGILFRRTSGLGGRGTGVEIPVAVLDGSPVGTLIATFARYAVRNTEADFWCRLHVEDRSRVVWVSNMARSLPKGDFLALNLALEVSSRFNELLRASLPLAGGACPSGERSGR